MAIEASTLTPQKIPEYVHQEADILAEGYRNRDYPCGEGLGVLASAIVAADGDIESGRRFATEQIGRIGAEGLQPYEEADVWKYLAWRGEDELARDTAWELLDTAVNRVKQSHEEKGFFDGNARYLACQTAERAHWLVQICDQRPESFKKALDAAKLTAETGETTGFFTRLYELGDEESLNEELKVFDADMLRATDRTIGDVRFLHDITLGELGVEAVSRGRFDQVDRILEHLIDDHSRVLVYAALLGKGRAEGLPFIEAFLERDDPWEGGWKPRTTYALAKAGYQPAIERLETSTDTAVVGHEEQRLYALVDMSVEGARDRLLAYIDAQETTDDRLYTRLGELSSHGLGAEALRIAETKYEQNAGTFFAYWIWQHTKTPDLGMWHDAYAGAKGRKAGDLAAPARALYTLAGLATQTAATA